MIGMAGGARKRVRGFGEMAVKKSLDAGTKIGAGLRKVFSKDAARTQKNGETDFEKVKEEEAEKPEQPDSEQEIKVDPIPAGKPVPEIQNSSSSPPNLNEPASASPSSSRGRSSGDLETECLVCEDLVHCEVRNPRGERCAKRKHEQS